MAELVVAEVPEAEVARWFNRSTRGSQEMVRVEGFSGEQVICRTLVDGYGKRPLMVGK